MLKIKINNLLGKEVGSRQKEILDDDLKLSTGSCHAEGLIVLTRLDDGVMAELKQVTTTVDLTCARCLDHYSFPISFTAESRMFLLHPQNKTERQDNFLIDMKYQLIDITEYVRQEIEVSYPIQQLCQPACAGLCQKCGTNLNHKQCSCHLTVPLVERDETTMYHPFADLKEKIKGKN